ncbi:MAG: SOS response-associated peptidase [Solirubrobacterales bacterium]|nr:SOS response-associated peptidase [Solirubrobacterales bacterium]
MCGRYTLAGPAPGEWSESRLRTRFPGLGESVELRQRFNVAPTDEVACVTTTNEGEPRGDLLRWGLVPHWAKDPGLGAKLINARGETVAQKPAFRDGFARRRCLIVADGFYEWERRGSGTRHPFHITRPDAEPFAFAGIWATWHGPEERTLRTCSIITTAANEAISGLHDRMPVILPAEAEEAWLDPATPEAVLSDLLAPLPPELTTLREVSRAVNNVRNDGPECLAPPESEPAAPTLF